MRTPLAPTLAAAALAAALAGCASTPRTSDALEQARQEFNAARSNPNVPRYAPTELNQAGLALDQAERLWSQEKKPENVAHQAYLARQQARTAVELANARSAQAQIEQGELQRRSAISDAQQREADAARRTAEAESAAAQQRAQELEARAAQEVKRLEAQLEDLKAQQTTRGWVLSLGSDVLFDVGQAALKPAAHRSIEQIAGFLRENPDRTITIEGYTDSTGSDAMNQQLSQRRADAVKQALIAHDIAPGRIQTRAFGEAYPVASNDTASGRQLNRRVAIVLGNAGSMQASR